jgi:hypothetical protein
MCNGHSEGGKMEAGKMRSCEVWKKGKKFNSMEMKVDKFCFPKER